MDWECPQCGMSETDTDPPAGENPPCPQCDAAMNLVETPSSSPFQWERFLSGLAITRDFTTNQLTLFSGWMEQKNFGPGKVLLGEGEMSASLFILYKGKAHVEKHDKKTGRAFAIQDLEPGAFFGEMSFLSDEPASATVLGDESGTVGILDREQLEKAMDQDPQVAGLFHKLVKNIAFQEINRLRATSENFVESLGQQMAQALESELYFTFLLHLLAAGEHKDGKGLEVLRQGMASAGIDPRVATRIEANIQRLGQGQALEGLDGVYDQLAETNNVHFILNLFKDAFVLAMEHGGLNQEREDLLLGLLGKFSGQPGADLPKFIHWAQQAAKQEARGMEMFNRLSKSV